MAVEEQNAPDAPASAPEPDVYQRAYPWFAGLSLAAAVACMKEYRAKPVHETIRATGQALVDGFNALGAKHGVPFSASGPVMMSAQRFAYDDAALNNDCWTLLLQVSWAWCGLLRGWRRHGVQGR